MLPRAGFPRKFRPDDPRVRAASVSLGTRLVGTGATRDEAEQLVPRMSAEWIDREVRPRSIRSYLPLFGLLAALLAVFVGLVGINGVPVGERWLRFVPAAVLLVGSMLALPFLLRAEHRAWRPRRDELLERFTDLALATYATESQRRGPRPKPRPEGVSHEEAETLARDWMRHLGVMDAQTTRYASDGGIDVTSRHYVAQVKNYAGAVTVESVRALYGVAAAAGTVRGLNPLGAMAVQESIPEAFGLELG